MIIGVPKETFAGEQRVALVPAVLSALIKAQVEVWVESGSGEAAGFSDDAYQERGARIESQRSEIFSAANVILQVRGLGANLDAGRADLDFMRADQAIIGFLRPLEEPKALEELARHNVTSFALELLPRITRAQSMDVLSSMSTITGYKSVLLAASHLPKIFPMMMTAAGTVSPARVLVVGAGVAGLQAISTAHRLGAVVHAYDIRPAVKEEVESLGARFVELPLETRDTEDAGGYAKAMDEAFYRKQQEVMAKFVSESDVVITTAMVPGKKAPILITGEMVKSMKPGSVIVDLAARRGGNCELCRPGETVAEHGVTIIGITNLASTIPHHASQLYAKNISNFVLHLLKNGQMQLNMDDEITRETMVTRGGEVVHPRVRQLFGLKSTTTTGREKE